MLARSLVINYWEFSPWSAFKLFACFLFFGDFSIHPSHRISLGVLWIVKKFNTTKRGEPGGWRERRLKFIGSSWWGISRACESSSCVRPTFSSFIASYWIWFFYGWNYFFSLSLSEIMTFSRSFHVPGDPRDLSCRSTERKRNAIWRKLLSLNSSGCHR